MSKSLIGTLIGLAIMAAVSPSLEGTALFGAWAGFLMGAGVACLIVAWQADSFRKAPHKAMLTMARGFALKLGSLAVMAFFISEVPALNARIELQFFLVAAAGGMFLLLVMGTFDNSEVLHESSRRALNRSKNDPARGEDLRGSAPTPVSEGRSSL